MFTLTDTVGRPSSLGGNPAPTLVAYRNAFESCSTAGLTLAINCNGLLGVQGVAINTNSDPAFYACGNQFQILLRNGCVTTSLVIASPQDSVCVSGYVITRFSLNYSSALRPLIHGCNRVATTQTGAVRINWAEIENKTAVEALSCTTIFGVTQLTNGVIVTGYGVGANPGTEQGIACTVWNSLQANYDVCGSFGVLLDCRTSAAVQPGVPNRRLDITATGAAGIDWGNVENKTTANDLDCTTLFKVHSVDNAILADACSAIFSVQRVVDPDTILDKGIAQPAGVFAWPASVRNIMGWLGAISSNCLRQTATVQTVRLRDDSGAVATSNLTCEATTVHRGSFT